ncbi:polyprenyl synthetase family protein [bacterium]|nr:polyprenyl synthetase family protein [bacterium]
MDSSERIQTLQQHIENSIRALFENREPRSLYRPMAHLLRSGGKRIRPMLLLLSAEAVGGDAYTCLPAAVAIELLHTFTLVHDDIMDHDNMRRGQPTVHVQWDEPTAILAGDGLVTMAYQKLLQTEHEQLIPVIKLFTEGLLVLCEGQALDKTFENQASVTLDEYLNMIYKKTAKLLEVSCEMGVILGNGTQKEAKSLRGFAKELGMAFQIQDDLLDLISEETVFGKPRGSDLIQKKQTCLTIHFEHSATSDQKKYYRRLFQKDRLSEADIHTIQQLFNETGTLQNTRNMVTQRVERAIRCLLKLKAGESRNILESFAVKIRDRVM